MLRKRNGAQDLLPLHILRFPQWQSEYEAVLEEANTRMLKDRIASLETVIFKRMQEIAGRVGCDDERKAMTDALLKMREIQVLALGYPPIPKIDPR